MLSPQEEGTNDPPTSRHDHPSPREAGVQLRQNRDMNRQHCNELLWQLVAVTGDHLTRRSLTLFQMLP